MKRFCEVPGCEVQSVGFGRISIDGAPKAKKSLCKIHLDAAQEDILTEEEEEVTEMFLCETERLFLRPNQLYRFKVSPDCKRCRELAEMFETPKRKE